jgi:hypothetical protein
MCESMIGTGLPFASSIAAPHAADSDTAAAPRATVLSTNPRRDRCSTEESAWCEGDWPTVLIVFASLDGVIRCRPMSLMICEFEELLQRS